MHNREIQQYLLNISLSNTEYLTKVLESNIKQFFDSSYEQIFDIISWYYLEYQTIPSFQVLHDEVKYRKFENEELVISQLDKIQTAQIPSSVTTDYLFDQLRLNRRRESLIETIKQTTTELRQNDVEAAYQQIQDLIYEDSNRFGQLTVDKGNLRDEALDDLMYYLDDDISVEPGILSGLFSLDETTNGIYPGELALVAARPAVGKSTLLLNIGFYNYYFCAKNVIYVSLEMPKTQLKRRFYSRGALVDYKKLKNKQLEEFEKEALDEFIRDVAARENHFFIFDISHKVHAAMLEAYLVPIMKQFPVDLLIVDYLGEMISSKVKMNAAKWEIQGEACRELRGLGRKYKIPIWTATQLTRASTKEKQSDSTHIAGSDMIAQIADLAISLKESEENKIAREIEVDFLKVRDAENTGSFKIHCNKQKMLMGSISSTTQQRLAES